ncbi:helix-turn-helix domain-containing protein [Cellulomonas sp. NPDC058312]|uniref:helix-turn-helix domain-containing protein n=1 Tax=Cellulomonas sp. NPDC058312 TaxID=3346441 RepID=UPI0036EF0F31
MVERTDAVGRRIAAARERGGLTQQELAGSAGMERSALAKIERGLRGVAALELAAIAKALDVRLEWFLSDGPATIASHRTRAAADVELSIIDDRLERLARDVELVCSWDGGLLGARVTPRPVPSSGPAADLLGAEARALCGLDASAPVLDLVAALAAIGLLAFSAPLGAETADAATTLLDRGGVALVNSTGMVGRRRLALAHELGHFLIADDYTVDWRVAEPSGAGRTEPLLDRFARAFLAPGLALTELWSETRRHHDLRTSAVLATSHFRVDMSTLARRLAELDLASAAECAIVRSTRTTRADIIEHGLAVPYDLEGVTLPRPYERAVLALYREERVSAERALSLLLGTLDAEDLPELRPTHRAEIWSVIS